MKILRAGKEVAPANHWASKRIRLDQSPTSATYQSAEGKDIGPVDVQSGRSGPASPLLLSSALSLLPAGYSPLLRGHLHRNTCTSREARRYGPHPVTPGAAVHEFTAKALAYKKRVKDRQKRRSCFDANQQLEIWRLHD